MMNLISHLHGAIDGFDFTTIGACMNTILEVVHAEWYQAASPTQSNTYQEEAY